MPCSSICASESSCSNCSTCSSSIRTIPATFKDTRTLSEIEAYILFRSRRLMYEYNAMRKHELENSSENTTTSLVEVDEEQEKQDELENVQRKLEDALNVVTATERLLRELKWWDEKAVGDVAWEKEEKKEVEKKVKKKKILVKGQKEKGKEVQKKAEKLVFTSGKGKGKEVDGKAIKKVLLQGEKVKRNMEEKKAERKPDLIIDCKGKGKQPEEEPEKKVKKRVPKKKDNKGKGKSVDEDAEITVETKICTGEPKAETSMQGAQREWGHYEWDWQGFQDSMF